MKAYELEVSFIGEPDYYYFESKKEAEKAADETNSLPPEAAWWGPVKRTAKVTEIDLQPNQYIQGGEIITTNYFRRVK